MSDFYKSRFLAEYESSSPDEDRLELTNRGSYLTGEPTREWSVETASYSLVGSAWGMDVPVGNARLLLGWEVLVCSPTVAKLEKHLRQLEIKLNTDRRGWLWIYEAYVNGSTTLITKWQAVVNTATVRLLTLDEAPPLPGAWGALRVEFTLTNPTTEYNDN